MEEAEIKELLKKAEEQFQNKDYDLALGSVEAVIKEDEDDTKAWFIKGQVFKMKGDLKEAQRCFDRGLASDLNNERLWLAKSDDLISLNRIEEAKRSLNRALKIKPGYADANITKGRLLLRTREFHLALDSFQNILKSQPANAEAWMGKGNTLFMGFADPRGGIESMLKAIDIDRDNVEAWMNVGVIHRSERQYEKAIGAFNEVLKIVTENKEAQKYRDFCIRKMSNEISTEEAKELSYTTSWDEMVEEGAGGVEEKETSSWDDAESVDEEEEVEVEEETSSWDDAEEEVVEEEAEEEVQEQTSSWDEAEEVEEEEEIEEESTDIPDLDSEVSPSWDSAEEVEEEEDVSSWDDVEPVGSTGPKKKDVNSKKVSSWDDAVSVEDTAGPKKTASSWDDADEVEEDNRDAEGVSSWDDAESVDTAGPKSPASWDSAEEVTDGRYVEIIELNCPKCGNNIKGKKEGDGPMVVECGECGASGVIH